jgi:hypothetical protein
MFDAFLSGLADYSVDERGDVGSWIRMTCIQGLTIYILTIMRPTNPQEHWRERLSLDMYHQAIGGILKQGVERLDNVRQVAGDHLMKLLHASNFHVNEVETYAPHGKLDLLRIFNG